MACRLVQNIKHSLGYDAGGIKEILLLDINDFVSYQFAEDKLYDRCYVSKIIKSQPLIELGAVSESSFNETYTDGIYKQDLTTYIRGLDNVTTSRLLKARGNRYLVVFLTYQDRVFAFGSDGGISPAFSQQNGQLGNASGYSVAFSKNSIYPLVELDYEQFLLRDRISVLGTENKVCMNTEDGFLLQV